MKVHRAMDAAEDLDEAPGDSRTRNAGPSRLKGSYYFFASSTEGKRSRRLADVGALLGAIALLAISVADHNSASDTGDRLTATLVSLPSIVAEIGQAVVILSTAYMLAILLAAGVQRRLSLVRDMVLALAASFGIALVVGWLVSGDWPEVGAIRDVAGARDYPVVRIAVLGAALLVASPHLTRPFRRLSRAAVALSALAAIVLEIGAVSDVLGAIAVGWCAAAAVHLLFGSPAGMPAIHRVRNALVQLGLSVGELVLLGERDDGIALYHGVDGDGQTLRVEVAGRDARNAQLASRIWRSLWQREAHVGISSTRLQIVEHEALMVLLAQRAGVSVPQLVAVGEARPADALIVFGDAGEPLDTGDPERAGDELVTRLWAELLVAQRAELAHRQLDLSTVAASEGGDVAITDWRSAVGGAEPSVLATDRAGMFALTALLVGGDEAIRLARASCGDAAVADALPYLQPATLSRPLRHRVKDAKLDLAGLRSSAATQLGVDPPELVQVQRVTVGKVVLMLLTAVAITSLLSWITDIGVDTLLNAIADADPAWLLLALVVGQTQFLGGALSVQGSVPMAVPYGPTVIEQMAIAFVKLAVPSTAARVATNVRYLQLQGVPRVTAFGGGGLDSISAFLVQVGVLGFLTLVDVVDLHAGSLLSVAFDPGEIDWGTVLLAVVVIAAFACGLLMIRRIRRRFLDFARATADGTRRLSDVIRSWRQVARLLGGNFASDFMLAVTLWIVCNAFGVHLSLATLLAIHLVVSLVNGFVPVPGGIGVWETLLSAGLVAAGVSEIDALAIAITWRLVTFYLPPIWGAYAMRRLSHHGYL